LRLTASVSSTDSSFAAGIVLGGMVMLRLVVTARPPDPAEPQIPLIFPFMIGAEVGVDLASDRRDAAGAARHGHDHRRHGGGASDVDVKETGRAMPADDIEKNDYRGQTRGKASVRESWQAEQTRERDRGSRYSCDR
jgi:hypothetical protein